MFEIAILVRFLDNMVKIGKATKMIKTISEFVHEFLLEHAGQEEVNVILIGIVHFFEI